MNVAEKRVTGRTVRILVISIHILCWMVFLSLPTIFDPRLREEGFLKFVYDLAGQPRWTNALVLIAVFYFNYLFAVPQLYFRRRYTAFALSVVCAFSLFVAVNYFQQPRLAEQPWQSPLGNSFNLFMLLIVYLVSFVLCLGNMWQQLREQHLRSRLYALKAQLNPHLLFNTLNNIYSLSLTASDHVPAALVKLSRVLRYTTEETDDHKVLLERELDFVVDYVALERLRLPGGVDVSLQVEKMPAVTIPRFLLLPLLEYAFRPGYAWEDGCGVAVDVATRDNNLVISVSHKGVDEKIAPANDISRLRRQLDLLCPENYSLAVSDNGHIFVMTLQLRL